MKRVLKSLLSVRKVGLVLFGHGLATGKIDHYIESLHDDFYGFTETINIFEDLGFEFISMMELLALSQQGFRYNKNWLHLTFDDGYQNIYTIGYPYLKKKQIPFSLFASTHHIAKNERLHTYKIRCAVLNTARQIQIPGLNLMLPKDASRAERIGFGNQVIKLFKTMNKPESADFIRRIESLLSPEEWRQYNSLYNQDELLTIDQLRELAKDPLVHIGSHNHHHIILNHRVSTDDVMYEMQTSKNWLESNLKADILAYSYPNGSQSDFTPASGRICQSLGYRLVFTTIRKFVSSNTNNYEIPRCELPIGRRKIFLRLIKLFVPDSVYSFVRIQKSVYRKLLSSPRTIFQ